MLRAAVLHTYGATRSPMCWASGSSTLLETAMRSGSVFGLDRQFQVGNRFNLTPSANATWLDKEYADYYGVRNAEARADRPAYDIGDRTTITDFSQRVDYLFDQRQVVFLQAGYTTLGSKIKDSPLTERSGETMVLSGYLYRFK